MHSMSWKGAVSTMGLLLTDISGHQLPASVSQQKVFRWDSAALTSRPPSVDAKQHYYSLFALTLLLSELS
jgi:hypothetical protein